ncbi:MAG: AAA domain-containing protein [Acidobacteriota bacterium]
MPQNSTPQPGARRLLGYWRDSLADADLPSPTLHDGDFLDVDLDDVEAGRLPLPLAQSLFVKAGRAEPRRVSSDDPLAEDNEDPPIPVRFALFRLRPVVQHGKRLGLDRLYHAPLWIAGHLSRTGHLTPIEGRAVWLARRYLEPVTASGPAVGTVDAMDQFLTLHGEPLQQASWPELWAFAEQLFHAAARRPLARFRLSQYERFGPVVDIRGHRGGAVDALVQLYDRSLRQAQLPPLLDAICREGPAEPLLPDIERAALPAHCGQMTARFGLGRAQRRALAGALALADGELVAVNGPPGTGKTTLIQILAASMWVQRAIEAGEPPIQVVCSNNNRAVTQVLDTFADARGGGGADGDAADRWLPDIPSLGLYLPAYSRKSPPGHRYCIARREGSSWTGFPDRVESRDYLDEARALYLERAARFFDQPFDNVASAVGAVHTRLLKEHADLAELRRDAGLTGEAEGPPSAPDESGLKRLLAERDELDRRLGAVDGLRRELNDVLTEQPAWEDLLARLDSVRERRDERLQAPFRQRGLEPPDIPTKDIRSALDRHLEGLDHRDRERRSAVARELDRRDAERGRAEAWRRRITALAKTVGEGGPPDGLAGDPGALEVLFDRTLRRRLFDLAGRYWEGRWLLEADRVLMEPQNRNRQSRKWVLRRFRRWSMLTPVLIATLYQLPKLFNHFDGEQRALWGAVDQLIVDEAGQVAPEVGAVVFGLAKRAVVFGDVHQLEPIWNVPPAADVGNLGTAGIDREALEDINEGFGLKASEGSLMRVARRASRWRDSDAAATGERGVWLLDHRRSVPEVVRFCNRLVYRGRLRPRRPALPRSVAPSIDGEGGPGRGHPLPALGWAHVLADGEHAGSSRRNAGQAFAVAEWLGRHRGDLEEHYDRPLGDIVGLVTPYSAHIQTLVSACEAEGLPVAGRSDGDDGPPIAVGTVHTFQGGERPVMVFSPAVSRRRPGYFIDSRPNLLNVAVSRARDAFLVFGDLAVFDPEVGRPSGVLAQHLFEHPGNELKDVHTAPALRQCEGWLELTDPAEHRRRLREAIHTARRRALVVSPTLEASALDAVDLEATIQRSVARGVRVVIAYAPSLGDDEAAVERLRGAGARVIAIGRYLARILAVDSDSFTVGTFNWLAGDADGDGETGDGARSLRLDGQGAVDFVKEAWRDMREVRIPEP